MLEKIKSKPKWAVIPLAVILLALAFSLITLPMAYSKPKEMPVALLSLDKGIELNGQQVNMGQQIIEQVRMSLAPIEGETAAIKWFVLSDYDELTKAIDEQKYYGALVIPEDFSAKVFSLNSPVISIPDIQLLINQGMHYSAASAVENILVQISGGFKNMLLSNMLDFIQSSGQAISDTQKQAMQNPLQIQTTYMNPVGEKSASGNAQSLLFAPLWIASIVGAMAIYVLNRDEKKQKLSIKSFWQVAGYALLGGVVAGFTVAFIGAVIMQLSFSFITVALFLTVASTCYILLILAVLNWLGIASIVIFILIFLLELSLLNLPYEFMPSFYQTWVYPWLPMRFTVEGLREIFYFESGIWNGATMVLVIMGAVSLLILAARAFLPFGGKRVTTDNA